MVKTDSNEELDVIARSPFEVYYEGKAQAVSATNRVGDFDVLPGHADLFSILATGEVIIDIASKEPVKFDVDNGIMTVRDDQVMLFVNI